MKSFLKIVLVLLFLFLGFATEAANINGYCGAYASKVDDTIYSNAAISGACPGRGCPGLVKYYPDGTNKVVLSNKAITDIDSPDKMFSRPSVIKTSKGYAAIASVSNGYPPEDGLVTPSFLTSIDGENWEYHGKFKGDIEGFPAYVSGMAFYQDELGVYHYLTDGYGVKLAELTSEDGEYWYFTRNPDLTIKEIAPKNWNNPIFASIARVNGKYYLAASNGWPVTAWYFAYSLDGVNFKHLRTVNVFWYEKNINLYEENGQLFGLATTELKNSCYKKKIVNLNYLLR